MFIMQYVYLYLNYDKCDTQTSFSFYIHVDLFTHVIAVGSKALKSLCCIVMHNLPTLNKALLTYLLTY